MLRKEGKSIGDSYNIVNKRGGCNSGSNTATALHRRNDGETGRDVQRAACDRLAIHMALTDSNDAGSRGGVWGSGSAGEQAIVGYDFACLRYSSGAADELTRVTDSRSAPRHQ